MEHLPGEVDVWELMLPDPIRTTHNDIVQALDSWIADPSDVRSAAWVFWYVFDAWNKRILDAKHEVQSAHLDSIETVLRATVRHQIAEGEQHATARICYLYCVMSLIYKLDALGQPWAERTCELREQAKLVLATGIKSDCNDTSRLANSLTGLRMAIYLQLYDRAIHDGRNQEALNYATWLSFEPVLMEEGTYRVFLAHINCQSAVNAFERLWNNREDVRDWGQLGSSCYLIHGGYDWSRFEILELLPFADVLDVEVDWKGEDMPLLEFWRFAQGLCASQMSPSQFHAFITEERRHEAEKRLSTYFFRDTWEKTPEDIRLKLLAIDQPFFSYEQADLSGVVEGIWGLTKSLIRSLFWDPFVEQRESQGWHAVHTEQKEISFAGRVRELTRLDREPVAADFWCMARLKSFQKFLARRLDASDQEFVKTQLFRAYQGLNDKRKPVVHPLESRAYRRDDVIELYDEFIGVNRQGILPRLVAILARETDQLQ